MAHVTEELNFKFYLVLINLNLNRHTCSTDCYMNFNSFQTSGVVPDNGWCVDWALLHRRANVELLLVWK